MVPTKIGKFVQEIFKASDKVDNSDDPEKFIDIIIFKISYTFGVGPIGIKLGRYIHTSS